MGNSWDAKAKLSDQRDGKWEVITTNIGGPKVFNFRGDIDDALRSRCMVISMPSSKDSSIIINGMFMESILAPVKQWLESEVTHAISKMKQDAAALGYTPQRWVQADIETNDFRNRLECIKATLGRDRQQAAVLLEIDHIMGWKLEGSIKNIIEGQVSEDPFETEKEIIANYYLDKRRLSHNTGLDGEAIVSVGSEDLRIIINQSLKMKGSRDLTKQAFSILKREVGWQEGRNARKSSVHRGKMMLEFDEPVIIKLGVNRSDKPNNLVELVGSNDSEDAPTKPLDLRDCF